MKPIKLLQNRMVAGVLAASLSVGAALWPASISAAQYSAQIPDLGRAGYGWFSVGDDLLRPASGPGPVVSDPAHPYQSNTSGKQPTHRIADLNNSILQPWVIDRLKRTNERTLSGKAPFNAR